MADPQKYNVALSISFAAMFIIYATEAISGYLAFGWLLGDDVDVLISSNIIQSALPRVYSATMAAAVIGKSYCSISPLMAVLAEWPEEGLMNVCDVERRRSKRGMRVLLLLFTACVAFPCSKYHLLPMARCQNT